MSRWKTVLAESPILRSLAQWALLGFVAMFAFGYIASGLGDPKATVASSSPPIRIPRESLQPTIDDLNAEFRQHWENVGVAAAPQADWETVCRRMALALVGSGLSVEEMRYLESLPPADRQTVCLERLLADERFEDYWAERLSRTFVGADEGPFIVFRRRRFVMWIRDQLKENRPYDAIIRDLVTAQGLWNDQPEVNFLTVTFESGENGQPDPIPLASRTSRAFLGMRIDCLQCHDDFLGNVSLGSVSDQRSGTQQDFHQLAAFYSPARFNGLQGIRNEEHPYEYEYLYADETVEVPPTVPYREDLVDHSLPVREQLAQWMTHPENRQTARCAVNRVWALLFGKAMTDPVDDIPLHGPLPPGMDRLADDFITHGWDLKRLIRVITATDVFQLDSRTPQGGTSSQEQAWALFPVTRLRPEQVAGSIIQASRVKTVDREGSFIVQLQKMSESNDFVKRYGDQGEDEFNLDAVTITQRLLMLNGNLVKEHTKDNLVLNACTHISMFATSDAQAVETAYLAVLNRQPSEKELATFVSRIEAHPRRQAIEDMYWVLLNSSELAWNH